MSINHNKRAHALLSASGSHRWMSCTPSALLEENFGERTTSAFAAEGTLAHELSELYIRKDILGGITYTDYILGLEKIMSNELFNEEMLTAVPVYTDYVEAQYNAAVSNNKFSILEIEQKLDLTHYIPESFGTADAVIISDGLMQVIDLKYGKGIPVYATMNPQLMIYGLGALDRYDAAYDIEEVELTIVQPRINNISSFRISVDDLLKWANEELMPKAQDAINGRGELASGEWCRFCAVHNKCRALYEEQLSIAKYEFKEPNLLTDEEISDVLSRSKRFTEWINSINEYASKKAIEEHKHWPGYKLVEGKSNRKLLDEDTVVAAIKERMPEFSDDQIYDVKLKSLTELEKLIGAKRFATQLGDMVVKPTGKPTLVPESDKRPAIGIEQAQIDFKNE